MQGSGTFFKKVGNDIAAHELLVAGKTRPTVYTDRRIHEHVQDASLPNYRMVWGDFARYTGLRGSNQQIQAAILAGEDLVVDSVPELAAIVDDKNSFAPGELEKGLATMLHPENRHIVIGVPRIEVTLPEDADGTISSPFVRSVQAAREIHNAADGLTRAGMFELSSAAFGKWFLRPRAYFAHLAGEALNAAHALSHDFQQSYLVAGAAGRLGALSEALCGPSRFEVSCVVPRAARPETDGGARARGGGAGRRRSPAPGRRRRGRVNERILRIVRGDVIELYRVRLLDDGSATLERFENGSFAAPRTFRAPPEPTSSAGGTRAADPAARMKHTLAHITGFLNGTVSFGERELLSPTSAVTRNARWFPGDIQMLRTSFHYVRELFPSAQFHVTQLFRRVFGDVAFLALVILSGALWLGTDTPVASPRLSLAIQIVSMVAIFGFDRYWEPLRLRLRRRTSAGRDGAALAPRAPGAVAGDRPAHPGHGVGGGQHPARAGQPHHPPRQGVAVLAAARGRARARVEGLLGQRHAGRAWLAPRGVPGNLPRGGQGRLGRDRLRPVAGLPGSTRRDSRPQWRSGCSWPRSSRWSSTPGARVCPRRRTGRPGID